MEKNILEVKDLVVRYETEDGIVRAVNSVNLSIGQGSSCRACRRNRSGKNHFGKVHSPADPMATGTHC